MNRVKNTGRFAEKILNKRRIEFSTVHLTSHVYVLRAAVTPGSV